MPGFSAALPVFFAQNAGQAGAGGGGAASQGLITFLPYVAIIGLWFYFLLIRPQQKQEKERRTMLEALKRNDRVLTSGGIFGTVLSVDEKDDRVVLRVDDDKGVKLTVTRGSIVRIMDGASKEKEKEKAAENA
jgi:preprotein translocase subunit YajC